MYGSNVVKVRWLVSSNSTITTPLEFYSNVRPKSGVLIFFLHLYFSPLYFNNFHILFCIVDQLKSKQTYRNTHLDVTHHCLSQIAWITPMCVKNSQHFSTLVVRWVLILAIYKVNVSMNSKYESYHHKK